MMKKRVRIFSAALAAAIMVSCMSMPVNAAVCIQHVFYQKYLAVVKTTRSEHTVRDENGNQVSRMITITHNVVDQCKNCGYHGSNYLITQDSYSINH
ncbi:MAG: hypothetical protein NC081_05210 [Roseburia sp.]|nr:hypothetical protein [Roseburia sp.]